MKDTFEFTLSDGRICRIEAEYECIMRPKILDADGMKIEGMPEPYETDKCNIAAYVDGKLFASCYNPSHWRANRYSTGVAPFIWGLPVGFADPAVADKYNAWIADVIETGKSDEVKEYEQEKRERKIRHEVEKARKIIAEAERQEDIPSKGEAIRRMRWYNDTYNEGGEGYVPHIYDIDEYNDAKRIIAEYGA